MVGEFSDPSELPQASSYTPPEDRFVEALCPQCRHEVDAVCPNCQTHVEIETAALDGGVQSWLRFVLLLRDSKKPHFTLECLLIATGQGFADGVSMTDTAKKWGVTRAMVSKHCRAICENLLIRPSRYMMAEESAAKFKLTNRRPVKV